MGQVKIHMVKKLMSQLHCKSNPGNPFQEIFNNKLETRKEELLAAHEDLKQLQAFLHAEHVRLCRKIGMKDDASLERILQHYTWHDIYNDPINWKLLPMTRDQRVLEILNN